MQCTVLRSSRKDFTYLYLPDGREFNNLPESLQKVFGEPVFVMTLNLTPESKLANADITQVMQNLAENGYHLQMPPQEDTTGLLDLPDKK